MDEVWIELSAPPPTGKRSRPMQPSGLLPRQGDFISDRHETVINLCYSHSCMAEEKPDKDEGTRQLRDRAEALLAQARSQLADIQRALGAVVGDSALQARLSAATAELSGAAVALSQALESPGAALRQLDLAALAGIVHSAETSALLTEASAQTKGSAALAEAVGTASAITRMQAQTLARDMFEGRIFDPYLRFRSAEDEVEYRRREAEARTYVAAQLARHTPEGDLNAGGGMIGAMLDAHAHGAGDSPEFRPRWDALVEATQKQRTAMQAAGQSTDEYDRNVTASVRRFLKDEGHLSDAEIDGRLTRSANPLDASAPFITNDHASQNLGHTIAYVAEEHRASAPAALPRVVTVGTAPPVADTPMPADFDPFAKLKAAGVQVTDTTDSGHGLTVQKPTGKSGPDVAG